MLLWVYAGPLKGRFLELPLEDALQAIEDNWAETTDGKVNHVNPFRAVSKEPNEAAERYAGRSEPKPPPDPVSPPEDSSPPEAEKNDKASYHDGKTPNTYDDRELTSDRERQTRRRRQPERPSL